MAERVASLEKATDQARPQQLAAPVTRHPPSATCHAPLTRPATRHSPLACS